MAGGTPAPEAVKSTRTSLNVMFVAVEAAVDGRKPMPSKLKVAAFTSSTAVESVAPPERFCHVAVTNRSVEFVRNKTNDSAYCPVFVKPGKFAMLPGPVTSDSWSLLVPSNVVEVRFVRLRMSIGLALLNVRPKFWNSE